MKLSEREVNLLLMKYEQNFSIREIAFILERPAESLKTELYRARKKLKKHYLEKEADFNGI